MLDINWHQEGKISEIQGRTYHMERLLDKFHEHSIEQRPGTQHTFFPSECPNH